MERYSLIKNLLYSDSEVIFTKLYRDPFVKLSKKSQEFILKYGNNIQLGNLNAEFNKSKEYDNYCMGLDNNYMIFNQVTDFYRYTELINYISSIELPELIKPYSKLFYKLGKAEQEFILKYSYDNGEYSITEGNIMAKILHDEEWKKYEDINNPIYKTYVNINRFYYETGLYNYKPKEKIIPSKIAPYEKEFNKLSKEAQEFILKYGNHTQKGYDAAFGFECEVCYRHSSAFVDMLQLYGEIMKFYLNNNLARIIN